MPEIPDRKASSLGQDEILRLHGAIVDVLTRSPTAHRRTAKDLMLRAAKKEPGGLYVSVTEHYDLAVIQDWGELERTVRQCRRCGLRDGCSGVVFGDGQETARLVVCGEGPGADEDRLGRPFVGRAGQLLDKILEAGGFDRNRNAYILNVVKCRPPGNRIPTEEEREACGPNLEAQMRLIRPAIVLLLGATALQAVVDPAGRITRDRGRWVQKDGVWYMPTYHPAALLRNPNLKRDTWEDMKQVVRKYRELVDPDHACPHPV